jgi:uncharacterized protein YwqG
MKELKLPKELEPLRDKIEATRQDYVKLIYTPADNEDLSLTQSKMGGYPYMPPDFEYPLDVQGKKMILIAQINFAEVPPLEGFPTEGILQFFITDDEMLGMEDEYNESPPTQEHFRVLYHPIVDASNAQEVFDNIPSSLDDTEAEFVEGTCALSFEKKTEFVPSYGFDCEQVFDGYDMIDFLQEHFPDPTITQERQRQLGHAYRTAYNGDDFLDDTLGGYAYAIQGDIRCYDDVPYQHYIQLLQISTQPQAGILRFGSTASAHLYIDPEDLKKRDFSKVIYSWACG